LFRAQIPPSVRRRFSRAVRLANLVSVFTVVAMGHYSKPAMAQAPSPIGGGLSVVPPAPISASRGVEISSAPQTNSNAPQLQDSSQQTPASALEDRPIAGFAASFTEPPPGPLPNADLAVQMQQMQNEMYRQMQIALQPWLAPPAAARVPFSHSRIARYTPFRLANTAPPAGTIPSIGPSVTVPDLIGRAFGGQLPARPVPSPEAALPAAPDGNRAPAAAAIADANSTESSYFTLSPTINARAAAVVDTTPLNSAAMGLFMPSAIPARGQANFGLGEQTTFQGTGSSGGLDWAANIPEIGSPVNGGVRVELLPTPAGDVSASLTQAWISWSNLTFGQTDSTFNDLLAIPETIDLGGPISRTAMLKNTTEIRYTIWQPSAADLKASPTGFYANVAAEMPNTEIFVPTGFQTFSRYPDFVATLKYQDGVWGATNCTQSKYFEEAWHVQLGALVRDLGVEDSNKQNSVLREETTGWGLQLSGRYTIPHDCDLYDFVIFNAVGGEGLARYFNDLSLVSPVNDAAFNPTSHELEPLPVFGYFLAYQHDWNRNFRSTACYSHLDLDSNNLVLAPGASPYRHGDYVSVNLIFHYDVCIQAGASSPPKTPPTEHTLYAGIEYLYGHIEDLNGDRGQDQRLMFMVAATK
jgi:hypothetical protein